MRKLFKMSKFVVAAVLLVVLLCGSAFAASYGAKVLTSSMTVYSTPSSTASSMGKLDQGTSFTVTAMSDEWARISYKGNVGYAKMKNIIFNKSIKGLVKTETTLTYVTKESYRLNLSFRATLAVGAQVKIVGVNGDYLLVENSAGTALGYIKASCVTKG